MTDQPKPFDIDFNRMAGERASCTCPDRLLNACDEIERLYARIEKLEKVKVSAERCVENNGQFLGLLQMSLDECVEKES